MRVLALWGAESTISAASRMQNLQKNLQRLGHKSAQGSQRAKCINMDMKIEFMPDDMILNILTFCSWKDRIILKRVCKAFKLAAELFNYYKMAPFDTYLCIKYIPSDTATVFGNDMVYEKAGFHDKIIVTSPFKFKTLLALQLNPKSLNCTSDLPCPIDTIVNTWKNLSLLKIDWIDASFDFNIFVELKNLSDLSVESSNFNEVWREQILHLFAKLPKISGLTFHSDPIGPTEGLFTSDFLNALYDTLKDDKQYKFKSWPARTVALNPLFEFLRKCRNANKAISLNLGLVTFARRSFHDNWVNLPFHRMASDVKCYSICRSVFIKFLSKFFYISECGKMFYAHPWMCT